jgi:hypothetical protein
MVLFVLIGIGDRESGERFVELVAITQVRADDRGIPGARVGERQRVAAALGEERVISGAPNVSTANLILTSRSWRI